MFLYTATSAGLAKAATVSDYDGASEHMLRRPSSIESINSIATTGSSVISRLFKRERSLTPSRASEPLYDCDEQARNERIQTLQKNKEFLNGLVTEIEMQALEDIKRLQGEVIELKKKLDSKDSLLKAKMQDVQDTTALRHEIASLVAELTKARATVGALEAELERVESEQSKLDRSIKAQETENRTLVQALAEGQDELKKLTGAAEPESHRVAERETDFKVRLERAKDKIQADLADKDALIDSLHHHHEADKLEFERRPASKDATIKKLQEGLVNGTVKSKEAATTTSLEIEKLRSNLSEKSVQIDVLRKELQEAKQYHEVAVGEIADLKNQASFPLTATARKAAKEIQNRDKIIENLKAELAKKNAHIRASEIAASLSEALPSRRSFPKPKSRIHQVSHSSDLERCDERVESD
ncbi:hypothetical protein AOQ84DRAFT_415532 [Glonium stellatum]|uniref:Uncharacterized protein n=1 Tax=Glonium stellatum TaxID=574774 RepID=A0A8E2JXQ9_9PEZI|nr:hypothetical protein AOQ84DRAFT_415532 [Glonium stellatum]